jgi:hypothetical protein
MPVFDAAVYGARPALSSPRHGVTSLMRNERDYFCRSQVGKEKAAPSPIRVLWRNIRHSHLTLSPVQVASNRAKSSGSSVIGAPRCR